MKSRPSPSAKRLAAAVLLAGTLAASAAIVPTEWQHRQALEVSAAGLVKVPVPPATFDVAQPGLVDLRVVDPDGREVASLLDRELRFDEPAPPPRSVRAARFSAEATTDGVQLVIETGVPGKLAALELETANPFFLKAAHVETSADGREWQSVGPAEPVFRQFGAEQLALRLDGREASHVRVTLDNLRTRPVTFTGARIVPVPSRAEAARPVTVSHPATIDRREEFAGETVLTVSLPGRHLPLAALGLDIQDPLFMRRVTVAVRDVQGTQSSERVIATGTVYRVSLDGSAPRTQLEVPVLAPAPDKLLLVHIHNGDSPPLTIPAVEAKMHPVSVLFRAASAGRHQLLSGNPQATPARYDLAAFAAELRAALAAVVVPGPLTSLPDYRPRETLAAAPLPEIPLSGAPLDTKGWSVRRSVRIASAGVQELELDPAALAGARSDFADLRLMQNGNQIPYVLERPALSRALDLSAVPDPDKKRPTVSRWRVALPQAGLPAQKLILTSTTPLFARQFRVMERIETPEGRTAEITLATGEWSRTPEPGVPETRIFDLPTRLRGDTLWLETDNGDNPPIALTSVGVTTPVVRLVFKVASQEGFELLHGRPSADAPRYDLSLVAARLLTAPRQVAQLDPAPAAPSKPAFAGLDQRYLFWGVLILVIVALLAIVAKMLPKPPGPP